jgi:hypothetical protein
MVRPDATIGEKRARIEACLAASSCGSDSASAAWAWLDQVRVVSLDVDGSVQQGHQAGCGCVDEDGVAVDHLRPRREDAVSAADQISTHHNTFDATPELLADMTRTDLVDVLRDLRFSRSSLCLIRLDRDVRDYLLALLGR